MRRGNNRFLERYRVLTDTADARRILTAWMVPEEEAACHSLPGNNDRERQQDLKEYPQIICMVLEETLLFCEESDADIFIRFLHEKNCRVLKKLESSIFEEAEMCGTIGNFIRLIETKMESEVQEKQKDPTGQEGSTSDPGISGYLASRKVSFAESNAILLAHLKSIRDYVRGIMAQFNPGDIIFSDDELKNMKELMRTGFDDKPGNDLEKIFLEKMTIRGNHMTLEDNGVVETRPEGICLIKKIDPDDLIVERRPWGLDEVDRETLKQYGIALKLHIDFKTETRIIIDPRIHFTCKLKEIKEVLGHLEADEFSEDELKRNLALKGLAIESILTAIETSGRISLTDLIRDMKVITPDIIDDGRQVVEHFTPEFLTGIISDLRKIGAIEGNDRKIRIAR